MSDSTVSQVDALVLRLKSYVSPTLGKTVSQLTAGRIYNEHGGKYVTPEAAQFPFVTLRKINAASDSQVVSRENFDIEVMVHHRGRPNGHKAEEIADVAEQALLSFRESSAAAGITLGQSIERSTLPIVQETNALKDVITVRMLVGCFAWPKRMTSVYA